MFYRALIFSIGLGACGMADSGKAADNTNSDWDDEWSEFETSDDSSPLSIESSLELSVGTRIKDDPAIAHDLTLGELRNRWDIFYNKSNFNLTYKADFVADEVQSNNFYHTREANLFYRASDSLELKLGRQILTWGTGDLVFLNDLFPKDWQSFFSGRDSRYLKAPSDAIKLSYYTADVSIDVIYTPKFDSDIYIDGTRISTYSPFANKYMAAPPRLSPTPRDSIFGDSELAVRLSNNFNGNEYALYYYKGFFKSPIGLDSATLSPYFPTLEVGGGSYRGTAWGGIFNTEFAYYKSQEDSSGKNLFIPNDQLRFLMGFEKELITNLTVGFQYYLEWLQDYDDLAEHSPNPNQESREYRNLWTNRLTYQALNGNLTYSLFTFYSHSDQDGYLRPSISYRLSDKLHFFGGGNLFFGKKKHTFFNRFKHNSNLYLRIKYYF